MSPTNPLNDPANLAAHIAALHPEWAGAVTKISGGLVNLTCRSVLTTTSSNTSPGPHTVILKHAEDLHLPFRFPASRMQDEQMLLNALAGGRVIEDGGGAGNDWEWEIRTPQCFTLLENCATLVLEDAGKVPNLKELSLEAGMVENIALGIGKPLGGYLRYFHAWGRSPAQAELRAKLTRNGNVAFKRRLDVGGIAAAMQRFPDELAGFGEGFEQVAPLLDLTDEDEIGVIHGDFWTGKVIVDVFRIQYTLWIIDWELAQVPLPPFDLGQICAELYLLFYFTPHNSHQLTLITLIAARVWDDTA